MPSPIHIEEYLRGVSERVNDQLRLLAAEWKRTGPKPLTEAVEYALLAGGKRLRPALVLASCEALGGDVGDDGLALRFALALEMVHTYSLVHDDLPCMDDDDLRRGRPTVHKAYDEATAMLVGDGLQSLAFRHLLSTGDARAAPLAALLAESAWRMVEGQALDIGAEGRALGEAEVLALMAAKTGALLTAACAGGAIAATGAPSGLDRVGQKLGLAFQIADDLLDLTSDAATLGKRAGKDQAAGKATLPSIVGIEEARRRAQAACDEAVALLAPLGAPAEPLRALARFVLARKK
ncbi:polyprenyl synthetase family protein [Anaeromyxobacter paludicola]|uniref:(2E,6E)-farnesyl diphosphate synthase n=1 Tax=Anaeromyxobacter paludicola TaxID=2918171 RepID=A0ABN6N6Z8_9BACT|nr:polyprenyl synthetase family protein [Anaeromyxobacter paludicola]BDG08957.1 (2E,6E)-farnesyl diphosphate synthase [Anaeromyxobacter paludicola]